VSFDRELIEAKLSLKLIASSDMPRIAWDALEAGLDGPAIRRLAALVQPTYFEVAEVLPRAMEELGLSEVQAGQAALRIAKHLAADILQSGDDPLGHIRDFEWLWIRADYAGELSPVGNLVDEVFIAQSTGQSDEVIRDWVTERFRDLARLESQPDTVPLQPPESGR
jgi:hypothetical protein